MKKKLFEVFSQKERRMPLFLLSTICWLGFFLILRPVQAQGVPGLPATYYGTVQSGSGFVPTAGMRVAAYVSGMLCGESQTQSNNSDIVYQIHVIGAGPDDNGCGAPQRSVTFFIESEEMAPMIQWDNSQVHEVHIYPVDTPTPSHTPTSSNRPLPVTSTATNSATATATATKTATGSPTNTATPSNTPLPATSTTTNSATPTITATNSATATMTNTVTATITATPTMTPTATIVPTPVITSLDPVMGRNVFANEINIYGNHFQEESIVRIELNETTDLLTTFISATHLRAVIPADQEVGLYDLIISHPEGTSATLSNAYTVLGAESDDLFSRSYSLLTNPLPLRAGDSAQISLQVQRQGGSETLSDVTVEFYLGNPNNGGTLIGKGTVTSLAANSSGISNNVIWNVPKAGTYRLFAVIDPNNQVNEVAENNNIISRPVRVLRAAQDTTPPTIDEFTINGGASQTTDQSVELSIGASDPGPSSTGVQAVHIIEYEFNKNTGRWIPAQRAGWQRYQSTLNWTVLPSSGLKYLQIWVADGAGNISRPHVAWINYLAASDTLPRRSSRFYLYHLNTEQSMSATLTPISGDPDLYVWSPQAGTSWSSFNLDLVVDEISFTAPVNGLYVVEVYAYETTEYHLTVSMGASIKRSTTHLPTFLYGEKIAQSEPGLAAEEMPEEQPYAVPAIEEADEPTAITFHTLEASFNSPTALFSLLIIGLLGVAAYLWPRKLL